jgi:hypothetical protein
MRKVLTALITTGCVATAAMLSASTASAQVDAWNGGWHVGGDYYQPTDYSYNYGSAPLYNYASAPIYNSAPGYGYGAYGYGAVPAYNPAIVAGPVRAPLYDYAPGYGAAAVAAPIQTVEIVRTVYVPARSAGRREIATRQTARRLAATNTYSAPARGYTETANVAAPAYRTATYYDYAPGNGRPLYDMAVAPMAQPIAAPASAGPVYRYVYQWNGILVVDPITGAVIHTIPR